MGRFRTQQQRVSRQWEKAGLSGLGAIVRLHNSAEGRAFTDEERAEFDRLRSTVAWPIEREGTKLVASRRMMRTANRIVRRAKRAGV